MAIRPISSTGYYSRNNANMVQFGARKNEENREHRGSSIRNTAMAVPLATLLAMSPLNASSVERNSVFGDDIDNTEMVEQKKYVPPKDVNIARSRDGVGICAYINDFNYKTRYDAYIEFRSQKGNGKFQTALVDRKYRIKDKDYEDVASPVRELRTVNYVITDSNQKVIGKFSADQIVAEDSTEYNDPKIVQVAKDFVNGKIDGAKNDGAIKIGEPITRNIYLYRTTLLDKEMSKNWLDWTAKFNDPEPKWWGDVVLSADIETDFRKYRLNARDKDGNPNTFEQVTIEVDGKSEFNIVKLLKSHINILDHSKINDIDTDVVIVAPKARGKIAYLADQQLYETLLQVTKDTRYNNALNVEKDEVNNVDLKEFFKK